jgi:hypothetical protein
VLPTVGGHLSWVTEIDTGHAAGTGHGGKAIDAGDRVLIPDFSLMVLRADEQPPDPASMMSTPPR